MATGMLSRTVCMKWRHADLAGSIEAREKGVGRQNEWEVPGRQRLGEVGG